MPNWTEFFNLTSFDAIKPVAALATVLGFVVTLVVRWLQHKRLIQEKRFQSDAHILNLCRAISDPSQRLQFQAAALMFERVRSKQVDVAATFERAAIIQALIAATIDDRKTPSNGVASPELCKYIADALADQLDGVKELRRPFARKRSNFAEFYWQRANLAGGYWLDVNVSGVDFFGVNFEGASLKRANLRQSILMRANLRNATLVGADLTGADLRFADLSGADFSDENLPQGSARMTKFDNIKLGGATFDASTRFPAGFDPFQHGMESVSQRVAA